MVLLLIGFLIGTVLGSFGLVLASRSLKNQSFGGRSKCEHCKHTLSSLDLFPIFSYLLLKGKCRYCKKRIGIEYPIVEVLVGLLIGFLFFESFKTVDFSQVTFRTFTDFQFINLLLDVSFKTFFITVLTILFVTDYKEMFIPDRIVIPAIKMSLVYLVVLTIYKIGYLYYYLNQTILGKHLLPPYTDYFQRHALIVLEPLIGSFIMGAALGGFFLFLIFITRGKGMGGGDVKLGVFMGLVLGFPNALLAVILAFVSGAIVSLGLVVFGKKHFGQHIAFGPYLVLGSLIAFFWGNIIINWYLHLSPY